MMKQENRKSLRKKRALERALFELDRAERAKDVVYVSGRGHPHSPEGWLDRCKKRVEECE